VPDCSTAPTKSKLKKKKADFVDMMISNLLRDLLFSRNHPLKSDDDLDIGILKNEINLGSLG
jgi:hypothetical protein